MPLNGLPIGPLTMRIKPPNPAQPSILPEYSAGTRTWLPDRSWVSSKRNEEQRALSEWRSPL
jgi:hypothetical protein